MKAAEVLADGARRLTADLRTRFPTIDVVLRVEADGDLLVSAKDAGRWWGITERWLDLDDEADYDPLEGEELVLMAAQEIADNLWPDELIEPWPPCPKHPGHPLSPKLVRKRASWTCLRDYSVAIPIGDLGSTAERA